VALLEVQRITVGYGELPILRSVSLRVERQEIVTIVGPNGAGKSTLLKTIAGLLKPQDGTILLDGHAITHLRPHRIVQAGVCYVPQTENVFPSLTVEENLDMGAFIHRGDIGAKKAEMYALFPDLREKRKVRAGNLSGGQRQMVAMARALMLDPILLLLDEPTAGLSPMLVGVMLEKIVEINRTGVAILIVEQNARQALQRATRGYVLAMGQNRYEDSGPALLAHPEIRAMFLGGS
jgi:ABC-type branched-subunit amino acid transport system ATPase component